MWLNSAAYAVCAGSFGPAFAKLLWPLVNITSSLCLVLILFIITFLASLLVRSVGVSVSDALVDQHNWTYLHIDSLLRTVYQQARQLASPIIFDGKDFCKTVSHSVCVRAVGSILSCN